MGTSIVENLLKSGFLFAFSPTKLLGNIHQIYSIGFQKVSLKLQDLLKFKHFDSYLTLVNVYVTFVTRLVR